MEIDAMKFLSSFLFRILHFTNLHISGRKRNKSESITFLWDTEFLFYHPLRVQERRIDKYLPVNTISENVHHWMLVFTWEYEYRGQVEIYLSLSVCLSIRPSVSWLSLLYLMYRMYLIFLFSCFAIVFVCFLFLYLYELTSIRLRSKEEFVEGFVSPHLGYQSAGDWVGYSQMYAVNMHYM
jgi:hypothetical protein